jgi:predicted DsbA family dithiol-disulfide isomerase
MNRSTAKFRIDVYSDVICPWCYVGKRRLEQALKEWRDRDDVRVEVKWRPFQLNPTMPKSGMDRRAYLTAKFGSLDRFKEMELRLVEVRITERIPFAFEKIAKTPNTFLAHRLIWYSGNQGNQGAVVDRLFKGYFEEGLDIGSLSILVELADQAGLRANEFLTSQDFSRAKRELQRSKPKSRLVISWVFEECRTSSSMGPMESPGHNLLKYFFRHFVAERLIVRKASCLGSD